MKQITNLVNLKNPCLAQSAIQAGEPTNDDKVFINQLFVELSGIFPAWKHAFDSGEGVKAAKRNWLHGLIDQGINSIDQVGRGLVLARKSGSPFLPSVGQFVEWCNDFSDSGLPTVEQAWMECASTNADFGKSIYSHGIILAARNDNRCHVYDWRLLEFEKGLQKFKPIYNEYVKRALNGEEFTLPVMLEDRKDKSVTPKEQAAMNTSGMNGLKEALGL